MCRTIVLNIILFVFVSKIERSDVWLFLFILKVVVEDGQAIFVGGTWVDDDDDDDGDGDEGGDVDNGDVDNGDVDNGDVDNGDVDLNDYDDGHVDEI